MLVITGKEIKMGTMGAQARILSGLNQCISWNAHNVQNLNNDILGPTSKNSTSSMQSINIIRDTDFIDAQGFFKHSTNEINSDETHIIYP